MEQINWAPEHSAALREYLARGMSFSEIADAINIKFKTAYSRNAAIGRAKRLGLAGPARQQTPARAKPLLERLRKSRPAETRRAEVHWPKPVVERIEPTRLRCVDVEPRHLSLIDLDRGDCRYPYGGDNEGEAVTFCGHPRRKGHSFQTLSQNGRPTRNC
jgi:GcrA cell cycle regulator